jgi:phosphatidylserine decarboxylase
MSILKEGYPFIFPAFAAGLIFLIISGFTGKPVDIVCIAVGSILIIFALFCIYFFRDPSVEVTEGEDAILSPCNGTVMEITEEDGEKVVRVFLSIFSVHLQRSPVNGAVIDVTHKDGKFLAAWDPRAHIENEQNIFKIQSKDGIYTVRQIAGLVARRCVSWVKSGDTLKAGDKIGMIKFSSQVDLYMPKSAEIKIKPGDKVKAGITIIASK